MLGLPKGANPSLDARLLAGRARNEDACVLSIPLGKAIVQTVDILTPVVNDPYYFGRIACCNALSDVYAMGGVPWCAMNILCLPTELTEGESVATVRAILAGGMSALDEAEATLAGGHTVEDPELKYGLAVTGIIDPKHIASNDRLSEGLILVLTKALGTGILSTGIKANWEHSEESEQLICRVSGRLNKVGGSAIRMFNLPAATDITGFGLIGHALEMAEASQVTVVLEASKLPLLPNVLSYAEDGLVPQGAYRNRKYCQCRVQVEEGCDDLLVLTAYDPQTSGGLLLGVPEEHVSAVAAYLTEHGDEAYCVGHVEPKGAAPLRITP